MEDSDWTQPPQHALLNAPALAVKWAAESAIGLQGYLPSGAASHVTRVNMAASIKINISLEMVIYFLIWTENTMPGGLSSVQV